MAFQPVEWVLVIYYGISAHRATYGRLNNTKYTKDYIQLSRKEDFLETVSRLFPIAGGVGSVPLTYQWPDGTTPGAFVFKSADRPHLKWETNLGAPRAWKMTVAPDERTAETIPGDPSHLDFNAAEKEFEQLAARGAGQPYLLAIKLRDEPNKLHLRAYLENPELAFSWADLGFVPQSIRRLADKTSQQSALAWSAFQSGGVAPSPIVRSALSLLNESTDFASVVNGMDETTARSLARYLMQPGYGIFFDPSKNHDAWTDTEPLPERLVTSDQIISSLINNRFPPLAEDDVAAETMEADPDEVQIFRTQIEAKSFEVPDQIATSKTRGSAQRAFAEAVKSNYNMKCAVTGIATREFLVAAHIVPWSLDPSIRLDPSNGICLSLIVDRAFEKGYLIIQDDYSIGVDLDRVGTDHALRESLEVYQGRTLSIPVKSPPKPSYLQRRRDMFSPGSM